MQRSRARAAVTALTLAGLFGRPAWATLQPDELLLVVNKNVPEGRQVAEHYAKARNVPDGRIVELALPAGDEVPFDQYERDVVPTVRRYLTENNLQSKVRCLVTFYGVPVRVARRVAGPDEQREVGELQAQISKTRGQIEPIVVEFEKLAKSLDPTFESRLTAGSGLEDAARRVDRAGTAIQQQIPKMTDPAARDAAFKSLLKAMEPLVGPNMVTIYMAQLELAKPDLAQAEKDRWAKLVAFVGQAKEQVRQLAAARYDPAARAKAREMVREQFGLLEYASVVQGQLEYLKPGDTAASLDNELALLWWDLYPRAAWQINPLHHAVRPVPHPPVVMVSRMDAPDVHVLNRMMADTLRAEQTGLSGRIVVDTRGIAASGGSKPDPYGLFDQHLRNFAALVKAKPGLDLVLDEKPEVLPPNSVADVALYAGWYSVNHYVPGMKFKPGAVGYHIASFEMTSMHNPGGQWVPHLLADGCAASLGPVAEPYLHSFPLPDEFLPLLMTGKLTLAEAYWKTTPMVSWMISLVGDPLYNPYAKAPALAVEDLPIPLQSAAREPIPAPATRP